MGPAGPVPFSAALRAPGCGAARARTRGRAGCLIQIDAARRIPNPRELAVAETISQAVEPPSSDVTNTAHPGPCHRAGIVPTWRSAARATSALLLGEDHDAAHQGHSRSIPDA